MPIKTGTAADLTIANTSEDTARTMFGSDNATGTLSVGFISDARVSRWELRTYRTMKKTTPMDSNVDTWAAATGGGACMLRGWIEGSTSARIPPGRYDIGLQGDGSAGLGLLVQLYFNAEESITDYYYKFAGRLEMFNITVPVVGPQNFAAIIRVNGDIEEKWTL